jgi:hypothetical protein
MDWAMFTFEDSRRHRGTLNAGMILGFIRFNDCGYPTPKKKEGQQPQNTIDNSLYVVARCSPNYYNFDKKFVTEIMLITGKESIFVIPLEHLIGPLCVVPNIFTQFRMNQDDETWLAVKPRRKWGRHFGDSIQWDGNTVNST